MSSLRAILRLGSCLAWIIVLFPWALATRLLALVGAAELGLHQALRVQTVWARGCLWMLGIRVACPGGAPPTPCLLVSNHVSYVDILVLASVFPGRFVAKSDIAGWPLLGWMSRSVGTIFVRRGGRDALLDAGARMQFALDSGSSVILFPEGGSSRGATVEEFHSALFEGPAQRGIPCLPLALHYATPGVEWGAAWTLAWWGGMSLWRHAWRLACLPGARASVRWSAECIVDDDRKRLTERVRAGVLDCFEPLSQDPLPPDFPWPAMAEEAAS